MKVRELVTKLIEHDMDAEISVDMNFSGPLGKDEGLDLKDVELFNGGFGTYAVLMMEKM